MWKTGRAVPSTRQVKVQRTWVAASGAAGRRLTVVAAAAFGMGMTSVRRAVPPAVLHVMF